MSDHAERFVTRGIAIRIREEPTYRLLVEIAGDETPGGLSRAVSRVLEEWADARSSADNGADVPVRDGGNE